MALLIHSGTAATDLAVTGTIRVDISDVMLASLSLENNFLGCLTVGEEFAGEQAQWVEDALNPYKVTDTAALVSATTGQTNTMSFSASDATTLDIGYILSVDSQVGVPNTEQVQITALQGTTATVSRVYGATTSNQTGASAASNTVWRVVNSPTYPNSDLGKDMSRARINKSNFINRWEGNVNLDSEAIVFSQRGYVPGVRDELGYQFEQRLIEVRRKISQAVLFSRPPASGSPLLDYQTMGGYLSWLDGTMNSTAAPLNQATVPLSDAIINTSVANLYRQGAYSQVIMAGPNLIQKIGALYADRIRLEQSEVVRGFFAQRFVPSMANAHELVNEAYLNDAQGTALMVVADINRVRIRPLVDQFLYTILAPSFRDGDAARFLIKFSLEVRNSGTDAGYGHQLSYNLGF